MATYKYGRSQKNFVSSEALKKYRNENQMNNFTLAQKLGEDVKNVQNWISRKRVPKSVLQRLGIKARNVAPPHQHPKGGTLYACYVGANDQPAFLAFCSALKINAKDVL